MGMAVFISQDSQNSRWSRKSLASSLSAHLPISDLSTLQTRGFKLLPLGQRNTLLSMLMFIIVRLVVSAAFL